MQFPPEPTADSRLSAGATIFLWYVAVFLAALWLRLYGISQQNLWFDEHWTLRVASAPIAELRDLLRTYESSKPPLYFVLQHYWLALGAGEFWLRLPSAIFGALGCVVGAAIGRQLFGRQRGVWLGLLLAIAPFHIYYSQEARPYALWGLLMGLAFLFQLKFCANPQLRFLAGYSLLAVLASYTFPYGFLIVGFSADRSCGG
jgi:mannosyltransferase